MSGYKVIHAVDETLRHLLWSAMKIDPTISDPNILGASDDKRISFEPPFRLIKDTEPENNYLSLFLYRIVENPDLKNRPLEQKNGKLLQYPPLALNLFYLVTPLIKGQNSSENAHKLLSKTMQIFYDNAIVTGAAIQGTPPDKPEELRIIFHPISMEDITKLWSSFLRPYHLSIAYEVKVVAIDSERTIEAETVLRKRIEYTQR